MLGVDTDKETKEPYRPNFMQHFKEDHGKKPGKKPAPVGPQSIYAYFPSIPEGTEFKDYVSLFIQYRTNISLSLCS